MNGFVATDEQAISNCIDPNNPSCQSGPIDVMGYHTQSDIPNYWAYARNFVLQDRMFEPVASWSLPAHLFQVSGWSARCTKHNDPSSKMLAAQETSCCHAFLEPDDANNTGQTTAMPTALVAGVHYYIEALYKEGGGGDYVEVAWRKEGDTTPAANLTPIPGTLLSTYRSAGAPKFDSVIVSAGKVTITWTGSGTLQESTDLSNWSPVSGNPPSGFQVTPAPGEHKFYRLQQP